MERMMIFSSSWKEIWVHAVLFWRDFFTICSCFQSKAILHLVDTYDHSSLFSKVHGSVTKPLIRRRSIFSYQDVFPLLASCISFMHLPVFSREMYKVRNRQHQALLLSAVYLLLPATVVHELCTPELAESWSPGGTTWEGRGFSHPTSCVNMCLLHRWQSFWQLRDD